MSETWDTALETGHPLIDRQHRELIELVDDLETAELGSRGQDEVRRVLERIMDFAAFHFLAEEDLMIEVGYPPGPREEMIAQHREFTAYARLRVLEYRRSGDVSVLPLKGFLENWLTVHEFGLDRILVDFIREHAKA